MIEATTEQLKRLEDILITGNIHSYCYQTSVDISNESGNPKEKYGPFIQMVIYSDKIISEISKVIHQNRSQLDNILGPYHKISPQFIMYYINFLNFAEYTKSLPNTYLSNSFINIKTPEYRMVNGFQAQVFKIKLTAIIEGEGPKSFEEIKNDVRLILNEFNWNSRYIKIGSFEFGTTDRRATVGPQSIEYDNNDLFIDQ